MKKYLLFLLFSFLISTLQAQEKIQGNTDEEVHKNMMKLLEELPDRKQKEFGKSIFLLGYAYEKVDSHKVYGLRNGFRLDEIENLRTSIFFVGKTPEEIMQTAEELFLKNKAKKIEEIKAKIARADRIIETAKEDSVKLANGWSKELKRIELKKSYFTFEHHPMLNSNDTTHYQIINLEYKNRSREFKNIKHLLIDYELIETSTKKILRSEKSLAVKFKEKEKTGKVKRLFSTSTKRHPLAEDDRITLKDFLENGKYQINMKITQIDFYGDRKPFRPDYKEKIANQVYQKKYYIRDLRERETMTWERLIHE
ncbi:MAG: hypothetical protein N4A45_11195 [Flavobacteriales bacterium]|jgi:hypothetical protein|nr:hypothetical protein [Flavobacteriales bacterium]